MSLNFDKLTNPFIIQHLKYVHQTESPKIMHVWAALTCISACMQRHIYLDSGIGRIYANLYTLLIGPPGARKSSAIRYPVQLMRQVTDVRFAPDDTGDQRQGLIKAMIEDDQEDVDGSDIADMMDLEAIANYAVSHLNNGTNKHVLFVHASEFGSFIGQNNLALTRFLIKMWDGEPYVYRLSKSVDRIADNLFILAGGTTPGDLATLLPPQAIGQGFMARCILVYAPRKEKTVPLDETKLDPEYEPYLAEAYRRTFFDMHGTMVVSKEAQKIFKVLDVMEIKIHDTRFIYYAERRQIHLRKLAMVMAAARGSMVIEEVDVHEANWLLTETELHMPDALGEYGLSPVAVCQQKMLDFLRYAREPITEISLWAVMRRDMKVSDFKISINELISHDKIVGLDIPERGRAYLYKDVVARAMKGLDDDIKTALLDDILVTDDSRIH